MRLALVVVAPASQHNCSYCNLALSDYTARHICPGCGKPQPLKKTESDYFQAFGLERRFAIDSKDLETRFYKLSRALHPDRFTTSDPDSRRNSLERMGLINQAYQTLKDPMELRDYVLRIEAISSEGKKGQIPLELAESWFELQDLMQEGAADIGNKLDAFLVDLRQIKDRGVEQLRGLEEQIDQQAAASGTLPRNLLEKLGAQIQVQSYLTSMERDVAQKKAAKKA